MSTVNFLSLSREEKKDFLNSFDTIVTDCDGVIWNSHGVLGSAPHTLNSLTESGKTIFFLTNNSTKTKEQCLSKFEQYGFNVSMNNILNAATLTATYLKDVLPRGKLVYVIGTEALCHELRQVGIESFGHGKDDMHDDILEQITKTPIEIRDHVGAVVVGFDPCINYVKMLKAATYLKDEKCLFVSTNTDETFPSGTKYVVPGSGAILAGIQVASGRQPLIIGKPSEFLAQLLLSKADIHADRTLFIGDRCNTDILMGQKCGYKTLLVLSGVHSLDDVQRLSQSHSKDDIMSVPDYYTDSVSDLLFD